MLQYKRATLISLIAYAASFLMSLLIVGLASLNIFPTNQAPLLFYGIQFAGIITIASGSAWWYFRSADMQISARHGFLLGAFAVGISVAVDATIMIPLVFLDVSGVQLFSLYADLLFITSLLLFIVTTTMIGWYLGKKV